MEANHVLGNNNEEITESQEENGNWGKEAESDKMDKSDKIDKIVRNG